MNKCKICSSNHRPEMEDLRLNKKLVLRDIQQIMQNKYQETYSYSSLSRHFQACIQPYVDISIKSNKVRQDYINSRIQENINACVQIVDTLKMLNEQLVCIRNDMTNPESRKEARDIARILDDVLKTALQYSDKLKPEQDNTQEDVYARLLFALDEANIPVEYIKVIKEKWDQYGNKS
jgi:hypothetical protein